MHLMYLMELMYLMSSGHLIFSVGLQFVFDWRTAVFNRPSSAVAQWPTISPPGRSKNVAINVFCSSPSCWVYCPLAGGSWMSMSEESLNLWAEGGGGGGGGGGDHLQLCKSSIIPPKVPKSPEESPSRIPRIS